MDCLLYGALVHGGNGLALERPSVLASIEHAARVHGPLQGISLPAKQVISVGSVSLGVAVAEGEGLAAVLGPHVVELGGVPEGLVGDLGHADGVGSGAGAGILEGLLARVVHV